MAERRPKRILAVASGGGHWVQLLRLRPAFEGHHVHYVTVDARYDHHLERKRFFVVKDATRWNKVGLGLMALQMLWIMIRIRPDVVVSTGAAPGYFALRLGKLLRAKTVWLDSIANVERISMTGGLVRRFADHHFTQWEHLARSGGPEYEGAVL